MKKITYAGESVMTSDEIGTVLVELTAALAKKGQAEAVVIPICDVSGGDHRTAELVIGRGNDVLAVPADVGAEVSEPDFSAEVAQLRTQLQSLAQAERTTAIAQPAGPDDLDGGFDFDLDLAHLDDRGEDPRTD